MPYADPQSPAARASRKRSVARVSAATKTAYTMKWRSTPAGHAKYLEIRARYRERNRCKENARNAVNHAIRDGHMVRGICEVCGAKAEAHHTDYSKPLDVRWLCKAHHTQEHYVTHG